MRGSQIACRSQNTIWNNSMYQRLPLTLRPLPAKRGEREPGGNTMDACRSFEDFKLSHYLLLR